MRMTVRPVALAACASVLAFGGSQWNYEKKTHHNDLEKKKKRATEAIERHMVQNGIPGLTVGVSLNGNIVWKNGFGFADVESGGRCSGDTVMRIASISKSITAIIAGRLVDQGKLDLDKNIKAYLADFPKKRFDDEDVQITTRQLLSHTGGIRHYPTDGNGKKSDDLEDPNNNNTKKKEFLLNEEFKTVSEAMKIFENDPLVAAPGTKFSYTTHGFTVVSGILETVSGTKFPYLAKSLFETLGMRNSSLDNNAQIVPHRSRYYQRNAKNQLENCPEVNNSIKWAGGGLQSNVGDLLKFANAVLYSHQCMPESSPSPLISRSTLEEFWKGEIVTGRAKNVLAGLGWFRVEGPEVIGGIRHPSTFWYHTGAAVGASSVLLVSPNTVQSLSLNSSNNNDDDSYCISAPSGVCIAIICNLQGTSLLGLAQEIREIFIE